MDRTSQIPAVSPPGAWQRGSELRQHASPVSPAAQVSDGGHRHDGDDSGGPHAHHDLSARLDKLEGRIGEHHDRLGTIENAMRPRRKPR